MAYTNAQKARREAGRESELLEWTSGVFCIRSGKETLIALKTSEKGLTAREADVRFLKHGPNVIAAHERRDTLGKVIARRSGSRSPVR